MPPKANPNAAARIVDEDLLQSMIPDPDAARRYVGAGLIEQMDVWNNSAEWLIERCGLRCADYRAAQ